jgi:hypothetical protein
MRSNVDVHIALPGEGLVANSALVRMLLGVRAHVDTKVPLLCKRPAALVANERSFPRVLPQVLRQVRGPLKRFRAHCTQKRSDVLVDSSGVPQQRPLPSELHVAAFEGAPEGLLVRMHPTMGD